MASIIPQTEYSECGKHMLEFIYLENKIIFMYKHLLIMSNVSCAELLLTPTQLTC